MELLRKSPSGQAEIGRDFGRPDEVGLDVAEDDWGDCGVAASVKNVLWPRFLRALFEFEVRCLLEDRLEELSKDVWGLSDAMLVRAVVVDLKLPPRD